MVWADCETNGAKTEVNWLDSDDQETRIILGVVRSTTEKAIRRATVEIVPGLAAPTTISQRRLESGQVVIIKVLQTLLGLV